MMMMIIDGSYIGATGFISSSLQVKIRDESERDAECFTIRPESFPIKRDINFSVFYELLQESRIAICLDIWMFAS